jgi:hypothetical protein
VSQLKIVKPTTEAERRTRTTTDTWLCTPAQLKELVLPPFQRALRVTAKVQEIAESIKVDQGIIPGVLTIGVLDGKRYLVDGQHRREAFFLSECKEGCVDVRITHFDSIAEMADEYVQLNSRIVNMKPDDILRGIETSYPNISKIRKACPFVGYDFVRRGEKTPLLSMSAVLRCWTGSAHEVPHSTGSATSLATSLTDEERDHLIGFLGCAHGAWGNDPSFFGLYKNLNLMICMWLYRRMVITAYSTKIKLISKEQFAKCLMSVSAAGGYLDYLVNRSAGKASFGPTYDRLRNIFVGRLEHDTGKRPFMPSPQWGRSR